MKNLHTLSIVTGNRRQSTYDLFACSSSCIFQKIYIIYAYIHVKISTPMTSQPKYKFIEVSEFCFTENMSYSYFRRKGIKFLHFIYDEVHSSNINFNTRAHMKFIQLQFSGVSVDAIWCMYVFIRSLVEL